MSLTRRRFLASVAATTAALAVRSPAQEAGPTIKSRTKSSSKAIAARPRQPNLLFIWVDQHRNDVIGANGNSCVRTPNLDALAQKSFVFNQTYCTQPVCTPSRGCILSGLLPHNHQAVFNEMSLPDWVKTIAEYMPPEYLTAYYGKWHLGNEIIAQHGFRDWISIEDVYRSNYTNVADRKKRTSYHHFLWENGFRMDEVDRTDHAALYSRYFAAALSPQYTKAGFLGREAERFLRDRRDGQPFILSVNTLEPHPPTYGSYNDRYELSSIPTGPAFGQPVSPAASKLHRRQYDFFRREGWDYHKLSNEWDRRRIAANYYGNVEMVDEIYVGRILRALEDSGQADNTIVIYTSDHGDNLADHCLMAKMVFYEQSTRVPLMIHVPWLSRRQVRFNGPFSQVDLMPTMLDLIREGVPGGLDGQSRASVLAAPETWRPSDVMIEWNDGGPGADHAVDGRSVVTTDGWKLNLFHEDGPELYDLNNDPGELRPLGQDPAQRERIYRLSQQIRDWQGHHRDGLSLVANS